MSSAPPQAMQVNLQLRWSDQDPLGHVNNANIMTLLEEAKIRTDKYLCEKAGYTLELGTVIRVATTEYFLPVAYTQDVTVSVWLEKIGTSSYLKKYELVQNGKICVAAETVIVMFDPVTETSQPIPEKFRKALETLLI